MAGNFVVDVQASDAHQILQVPLLQHPVLQQQWQRARNELKNALRSDIHPLSHALDLQSFVRSTGLLFGRDASKWRPLGNDRVDVVEDETTRTTKRTGIYAGVELKLFFLQPYFDERLEKNAEPFVHSFGEQKIRIDSQERWLELIHDVPYSLANRKRTILASIHAKCRHGDPELRQEAMHALWELVIDRSFLVEITEETLQHVAECLESPETEATKLAAAVVWGVARVAAHRRTLAYLGAVSSLLKLLHEPFGTETPAPELDVLQEYGLGAASILMVDKCCRVALLRADPDLSTILKLCQCQGTPGSNWSSRRRVLAAKLLLSLVQRDHEVRIRLVDCGGLEIILALLKEECTESRILPYCMASILASFVLDDDFMGKAQQRKAVYTMFTCCLQLLKRMLAQLNSEERCADPFAEESIERDGLLAVRVCEACAQAIWGSSYYCALYDSDAISLDEITDLAGLATASARTTEVSLERITHSLTASLATFCSNAECAEKMIGSDISIQALLFLLKGPSAEVPSSSGHVIAAACTGIAFLACHPIGAQGDDCMTGPHREQLLDAGAFHALLFALAHPPEDSSCMSIVEQSAAIGVMYLSTMAGKLEESSLSLLSALLRDSDNLEMLEYLMASMWILLRHRENRSVLARAFETGAAPKAPTEADTRLADAIQVHELAEEQLQRQEETEAQEEEWGLSSLVTVGETWMRSLVDASDEQDANASILKLFEFLTASLCLFVIPDDSIPDPGPPQIFEFSAKTGCWWTLHPERTEERKQSDLSSLMQRALRLLSRLLQLRGQRAWKVVQLSCLTLWNISCRVRVAEKMLLESGICLNLLDIAEKYASLLPQPLERIAEALVASIRTKIPLLELTGSTGLARYSYYVPLDCPAPKPYLTSCKETIAEKDGIETLCALLKRLNERWPSREDASRSATPASPVIPVSPSAEFERDMSSVSATMELYEAGLVALLNLSVLESNRERIGKHGLETLFAVNALFSSKPHSEIENAARLIHLCSAVLQNISLHTKNRTRLYKAELSGSKAATRTILKPTEKRIPGSQTVKNRPKIALPRQTQHAVASCRDEGRRGMAENSIVEDGEDVAHQVQNNAQQAFQEWMDDTKELLTRCTTATSPTVTLEKADALLDSTLGHLDETVCRGKETKQGVIKADAAFQRTLCRPLCHAWENPSFLKPSNWNPCISEYRQMEQDVDMNLTAKQLLSTNSTVAYTALHSATLDLRKGIAHGGTVTLQRPTTCSRSSGQIPIMVLQSGVEQDFSPDRVPYNVVLSPQRVRTVISFGQSMRFSTGIKRPQLTMFEHVSGSRVANGLFQSYALPNGKSVHYYHTDGSVVNEQEMAKLPPPPRPTSIPTALQQGMPLTDVLNIIAKPPGSALAITPYRSVPRPVPLPEKHTLPVKFPESLDAETFGDLREDNLQLYLVAQDIQETRTTTKVEPIERIVENKEPWTLPTSIFKPRLRESDARDFYDTPKVLKKSFEKDWERCYSKEKFASMLSREVKALIEDPKEEAAVVKALHDCLQAHYWTLCAAFLAFSATGSGDLFHLSLNAFTAFLDECSIVDAATKRSDCDTIFIVANFAADKKSPEYVHNNEQALMRFEFMEALVRIAILKYIKNGEVMDLVEAVELLFKERIQPSLSPSLCVAPNAFRRDRLYVEDVDAVFKQHAALLKAIYSRYRMKPVGGGLRYRVMKSDSWSLFMEETQLIDAQFTLLDAQLCYLRSRMWVQDEIKDYTKHESLSFVDFLEALGRVADAKTLPTRMDLESGGFAHILDWYRVRDVALDEPLGSESTPLSEKLELLLDLIFRILHEDPSQPESEFSHDALLKLIKKKDKELGP